MESNLLEPDVVRIGEHTIFTKLAQYEPLYTNTWLSNIPFEQLLVIYTTKKKFVSDIPKKYKSIGRLFYSNVIKKAIVLQTELEENTVLKLKGRLTGYGYSEDCHFKKCLEILSETFSESPPLKTLIDFSKNMLYDHEVKYLLDFFNEEPSDLLLTLNLNNNNLKSITSSFELLLKSPKLKWVIVQDSKIPASTLQSWLNDCCLLFATKVIWLTKEQIAENHLELLGLNTEKKEAILSSHTMFFKEFTFYKLNTENKEAILSSHTMYFKEFTFYKL